MQPELKHDPGGKVRTKIADGMFGWAEFSDCGRYRHVLGRYWGSDPGQSMGDGVVDLLTCPYALWIGMNPSTATAEVNDPTITREIGHTKRMGLHCMFKANVMDYRATDPKDLYPLGRDARSEKNLSTILDLAVDAQFVIAAWGALDPRLRWAARDVEDMLKQKVPMWCVGKTKYGFPRHPLYVRKYADLEPYQG